MVLLISRTSDSPAMDQLRLTTRSCHFRWTPKRPANTIWCDRTNWREARTAEIDVAEPLTGKEALAVDAPPTLIQAVPKRRAEFFAGRLCAMLAIEELCGIAHAIPVQPDRSPCWPEGLLGSITHTDHRALAVAASRAFYQLLGVDLEPVMPNDQAEALSQLIVTPVEKLFRPLAMSSATFVTLAFAAKEALYKAIYPITRRVIEFHDVKLFGLHNDAIDLELDPLARSHALPTNRFSVKYQLADGHCLCLLAVEQP